MTTALHRPSRIPAPSDPWPASSVLGALSPGARERFITLGRLVHFHGGERLLREGELGTEVYLLLKGWFKVLAVMDDAREALLAVRAGGDIVGELACFDAQPRSATVLAVGPGAARLISRQEFLGFLGAEDEVTQAVMRAVGGKLRWATRRRQDFGGSGVQTRVARVLAELARSYGRQDGSSIAISVSLSQPELATLVGSSEPSVHRVLRSLRQRRIIETGYRRILIRDVPGLGRIAGADLTALISTSPPAPATLPPR
ncbi:Crp/Fnr family transcriptional regulator [Streptantibioticus rubrisoli]|uniref:Crp/Fnr family transcriptional regulator n=1 Tax=Streptantibioticus rubrisoli TaxID=1387313 RepID=A0ABT1PD76_9ACTN|nr:Crp/Fnr family transcriptional regulator [Streptantibioticus rubrisoli]MCQ4043328.1 Crp/Fnr family transcriptional regulator [Streptantibioticus rubrisoli]